MRANVWLRLGIKRNDPRLRKPPRRKRLWAMEQMHAFAAAPRSYAMRTAKRPHSSRGGERFTPRR
jgi:hypothetical protein